MSKVRIKVGPMHYSIACGAGEEEQVARLGALIDEHYTRLGDARAPLEAQNVVFAALFMADELADARNTANQTRAELAEVRQELQRAKDDAANALHKALSQNDDHLEKAGGRKAELLAEIDTLRKAEERARKDNAALKAEITDLQDRARHQHDLFGGPAEDAALSLAIAEKLEALAVRIEATANGLDAQ